MYTTADKRNPVLKFHYEIFNFKELRSNTSKLHQSALLTFFGIFLERPYRIFENSSATRAMIVLYNAVDTDNNNMLQARKKNAKIWLNFGCHFLSIQGGLCLF